MSLERHILHSHAEAWERDKLNAQNQVVARYVYASQEHVPDYLIQGGVTYRLVTDLLGSVRLVVNAETGAVAQRLDYEV